MTHHFCKKKIFCTIGPSSLNQKTLCRLEELGVSLFRINLSHTKIEDLEGCIRLIRQYSNVPICLDTEGAQIRTGFLSSKQIFLKENDRLSITEPAQEHREGCLSFYPEFVRKELIEGDLLRIDFDSALIQIIKIEGAEVQARVISSGWVGNNKAVSAFRHVRLPAYTQKDKQAIKTGLKMGVTHYALSFANDGKDVELFRQMAPMGAYIISKIESKAGYGHLDEILEASDAVLVDRGDLSREIPIELIPFYQRKIIQSANRSGKPVYIATNLLESMIENLYPTRAEVNDVINALAMGADGLVLAAETAIGKRPVETTAMIVKLINQFELSRKNDLTENAAHITSLLTEPHGGFLINQWVKQPDWDEIRKLKTMTVPESAIMDAEQIGIGTYSPLRGFMARDEVHSVLGSYKLLDHNVWTLPIVLQKSKKEISGLAKGDIIALVNEADGDIYATLDVEDIYRFPFDEICQKWFGTLSMEHPGVQQLKNSGDYFIGGKVTLLKRRNSSVKVYEFTPEELRHIFDTKGWSKIVGFHTRNVVHRGHEAIQKWALERTHCDGLLISPVTGKKKPGDFSPEILLKGYQLMIDRELLPKNKVFISAFSTYSRYSGAREAVFTALCRKNLGCSHFIVGRDHTGVGNFYTQTASQELFGSLGGIGIIPVFFNEVKYCPKTHDYMETTANDKEDLQSISGTQVRTHLMKGEAPPEWVMRPEISKMIIEYQAQGEKIFVS